MKTIVGTSGMVRQVNRDLIRNTLKGMDGASVADLARATGLSIATCSTLIHELAKADEIVELAAESQGGRPARRYAYNVNHSLVATVMFRTTGEAAEIRHSVRNGAGASLEDGLEPFSSFSLEIVNTLFTRLMKKYPNIKAASLSIPGIVCDGEIEACDIEGMAGLNPERHVADTFGLRTISENNMNLAAMGFYSLHAGEIASGLVYAAFHLNQLPGMGIVVNGSLVKGKSAFAGEVGVIPHAVARSGGKKAREREQLISHMAAIAVSAIAMINPDVFVLTGHLATPDLHDPVRARCLEHIDERHLPRFVVRPEYEEDSLEGMTALALASLSGDVKLIEKERLWSDPER